MIGSFSAFIGILGTTLSLSIFSSLSNLFLPNPSTPPPPLVETKTAPGQNRLSLAQEQEQAAKFITVEAALLGVADRASVYYRDLASGAEFSIEPAKSWIPASTIKAFVVLEAFRQRDLGIINFRDSVTIKGDNVVATELETSEFPRLREGTKATIQQLVEAMIIQSDNTAYNTLLDILDRRNINLALRNIGITETVVGEKLNLDDNQFQQDLSIPGRQPNTTTAKDLASFFDVLYSGKNRDSGEILDIFKRQKINNMIPALLPQSTSIAHKTGDWAPIYHDGGLIYRPNDPFLLTVFTNSGDPSVIARIARTAYYQTPQSVSQAVSLNEQNPNTALAKDSPFEEISLAPSSVETQVLGEETPQNAKFPTITAEDLGITSADFSVGSKVATSLTPAIITPGSLLYQVKLFIQNKKLQATTGSKDSAEENISLAKSRLTEVKTIMNRGEIKDVDKLLKESEGYLVKATTLAKDDPVNKDLLLVEIKQVNDLHFAVLNQESSKLSPKDQSQFIDTVYAFYQKNHTEVAPTINTSIIANPLQQKPAIGTVTKIENHVATVQFDDGTSRQTVLNEGTRVRSFQQNEYESPNSITTGDKIAIVGVTNQNAEIVPEFVLKDVPKELPEKHTGTIVEINPDARSMQILDSHGQIEKVNVGNNINIKSKDTNVSLGGIQVGSQVSIFGTTQGSIPSSSPSQTPSQTQTPSIKSPASSFSPQPLSSVPSATLVPNSSSGPSVKQGTAPTPSQPAQGKQSAPPTKPVELKATSVTVTVNGSGKNEVVTHNPAPAVKEHENKQSKKSSSSDSSKH